MGLKEGRRLYSLYHFVELGRRYGSAKDLNDPFHGFFVFRVLGGGYFNLYIDFNYFVKKTAKFQNRVIGEFMAFILNRIYIYIYRILCEGGNETSR